MNLNKIDFNLLKVFVIVYQEKSLTKASAKLFVTIPAVSQNIKKLRELLGNELFVYSHRRFLPTPYADDLYAKVFPLLDGISLAIEDSQKFDPLSLQQNFNIDVNPHIYDWLTPLLYKVFHEQSPKSSIVLHGVSQNTLAGLCDGSIDVAVHFGPEDLPPEIIAIPLVEVDFVVAVRRDHPFKKSIAHIDELLEYSFAHIDLSYLSTKKHSRLEDKILRDGKAIHITMRTTSISGLLATVMNTDTIAPCLPPTLEVLGHDLRQIKVLGLEDIGGMKLYAYFHQKNKDALKYQWILSLIKDALNQDL